MVFLRKKPSTQAPSSPLLPPLLIPTTESEAQNIVVSKKIRVELEDERKWFETLNLYRRAYNLTLEFMRKRRKPSSEFRTQICDWCQLECEENTVRYNSNLIQAAKYSASSAKALMRSRIVGLIARYKIASDVGQFKKRSHFVIEKSKWFYLHEE